MHITYKPRGVCSRQFDITLSADGTIEELRIEGGCDGNLQGIARLVRGRKAADVIGLLEGICCERKPTSCPDQLAQALKTLQQQE